MRSIRRGAAVSLAFLLWPIFAAAGDPADSVALGSTPQQVQAALGAPNGRNVQDVGGRHRVIWIYGTRHRLPVVKERSAGAVSPHDSPLLGLGSPRDDAPYPGAYEEDFEVVFENGRVVDAGKGLSLP